MNQPSSRRNRSSLTVLALGVALVGACGGRAVSIEEGPPSVAGIGATGGTVAAGGASGRASGGTGNVGHGGSPSGGSPSGGSPSAGAGGGCGFGCPPILCPPDSSLVLPNGACCPACVSNCTQQLCPGIACASGYHLEMQPDQCCPSCVPDPTTECSTGRKTYYSLRMALQQKYQYGCTTAEDCLAEGTFNPCEQGCSYAPILRSLANGWEMNLASEAARDCLSCPPVPIPPCEPPPPVACSGGQCVFSFLN